MLQFGQKAIIREKFRNEEAPTDYIIYRISDKFVKTGYIADNDTGNRSLTRTIEYNHAQQTIPHKSPKKLGFGFELIVKTK